MDLKEAASAQVDPAAHWYYRTKGVPLLRFFDRVSANHFPLNIVDVGAGSGYFSERLADSAGGRIFDATLVDAGYGPEDVRRKDARILGNWTVRRALPDRIENSLVLMMDVLEHVADDAEFLHSVLSRCRGKNYFFVTVPAFNFLWSRHDVFLGHKRRYTLPVLERVLSGAGVATTSGYYLYAAVFPLVCAARKLGGLCRQGGSDLTPLPEPVNFLLEAACRLELLFAGRNRLCGLSCVAEGHVDG